MTHRCMIVGTELALHREVIAGALAQLRPDIVILAAEPDEIDAQPRCRTPGLVIASNRGTIARLRPFAWILLFPGERDVAIASIDGRLRRICAASIDDLVTVVDEALRDFHAPAGTAVPQH